MRRVTAAVLINLLRLAVCAGLASLAGLASAAECTVQPADPAVKAYCGIAAPEDLVLYGDRYLIVSSMETGEHLFLLDTAAGELAPMVTRMAQTSGAEAWGDAGCPAPDKLATHGLDLARLADGRWRLLAVNHAGRESIEMFEVLERADGTPTLHWRGCVLAAENAQFNDVAGLPDGGFLATDPLTASWHLPRMVMGVLGLNTGGVYRWHPATGYSPVPNTQGAYPNGILLSASGKSFYLNLYLDGEVREHELESGEVLNRTAIDKPDNSALGNNGTLLVASHKASVFALLRAIGTPFAQANRIPFEIVAVNLDTFTAVPLYRASGDEIGGGTVAQPVGEHLYIGAFRGDRVLRVGISP